MAFGTLNNQGNKLNVPLNKLKFNLKYRNPLPSTAYRYFTAIRDFLIAVKYHVNCKQYCARVYGI